MRLLVTGSNGFIGSNFREYSTHELTFTDIQFRDTENYYRIDITRFEELETLFLRDKFDCVVHLAGEVGRINGEEHPAAMIEINELGTLNLIQLCLRYKTRLLFTSTSEVYGPRALPCVEEASGHEPNIAMLTNVYALSKLHAEHLVKHYAMNYGLAATIIRPFMIYGVGEPVNKYRSAMLQFILSALANKPLQVHRGAVRSWLYIDDMVRALDLAITRSNFHACPIFNIGVEDPHSMLEVANLVLTECGSESLIELVDLPERFVLAEKHADFTRAKRTLEFTPFVGLEEGIRRTVNWAKTLEKQVIVPA